MPRGGSRPGAGKPKGYKHKGTIEKATVKARFEKRIETEWDPIIDAELDVAKGLVLMFARDFETDKKTGKRERTGRFVRITSEAEIEELLSGDGQAGEDYYRICTQNPDPRMLIEFNTRMMGKPVELHQIAGEGGGPVLVRFVDAGA